MTAKAGLVGFTRGLAHDLSPDKITANCVVPGAIDTARPSTSLTPAHHLTHGTITGARGKPDDVAAMVRFSVVQAGATSPARPSTSAAGRIWAASGRVAALRLKC